MKNYFSIRVVTARNISSAIDKVQSQKFNESHVLCDQVLTEAELKDTCFPNGFESWMETHYEVVQAITNEWMKDEPEGIVKEVQDEQGHGGLYLLAQTLTDEFENKFKGNDWSELNYFDEINNFLNEKLK